jgi:hypothetical protein
MGFRASAKRFLPNASRILNLESGILPPSSCLQSIAYRLLPSVYRLPFRLRTPDFGPRTRSSRPALKNAHGQRVAITVNDFMTVGFSPARRD